MRKQKLMNNPDINQLIKDDKQLKGNPAIQAQLDSFEDLEEATNDEFRKKVIPQEKLPEFNTELYYNIIGTSPSEPRIVNLDNPNNRHFVFRFKTIQRDEISPNYVACLNHNLSDSLYGLKHTFLPIWISPKSSKIKVAALARFAPAFLYLVGRGALQGDEA